ncbi:MAG: hypothetical protein ACTSWQ_10690, partial [Candidatus Thorarchaeota archaeon]
NLRRIKILEEMAQNLYREWFVKFRFPGHEKAKFIDSALGKIPEGWEVKPVGDLIEKSIGGGWGKEDETKEYTNPVRVIRGTDFRKLAVGGFKSVPRRFVKTSTLRSRKLQPFDVIIENSVNASSRCVGTPFLVTSGSLSNLEGDSICASFCKMYRPLSVNVGVLLLLHMKNLIDSEKMPFYQNVATNGIGNFQSQRFLNNELVALPSEPLMFNELLEPLHLLCSHNYGEQINNLRQTRDLLLPKLISGKLDVSDLDIKIKEETE